jgi:hypothetical protein
MASARLHFYAFLSRLLNRGNLLPVTGLDPSPTRAEVLLETDSSGLPHVIQPMTPEAAVLYGFVPHYYALVLGPLPWGQTRRVRVEVDFILVPTREEAVAAIWQQIEHLCHMYDLPWDREEWEIALLRSANTS